MPKPYPQVKIADFKVDHYHLAFDVVVKPNKDSAWYSVARLRLNVKTGTVIFSPLEDDFLKRYAQHGYERAMLVAEQLSNILNPKLTMEQLVQGIADALTTTNDLID